MAYTEIPARSASATLADVNPAKEIHDRATELQTLASRVISLAQAVDDASEHIECNRDFGERHSQALGSIINFADMIEREARDIIAKGELIEIMSRDVEPCREAAQ